MGGLALGSLLAGRFPDRLRAPVRACALAEAGVGLYALAVPLALARYPALNALLYRSFGAQPVALTAGRFLATAALLLVPTTLMGATLPLLGRALVLRPGDFGLASVRLGALYSVNTFGAVV